MINKLIHFYFQRLFTPPDNYRDIKGEVAENQPPFRAGAKLIFNKFIFYSALIFCFALCNLQFVKAQNLVPNPSFEDYTICPDNYFMLPNDWYTCSGDPDYYNVCDTTNSFGVPYNGFGYQFATDGNAYCGFYALCVYESWFTYKEYLGCELILPLVIGQKYFISFKINFSGHPAIDLAVNNIGLLFSTQSYQDYQPYDTITCIPTINFAHIQDTNIIFDDISWTTVKSSIIADSNYQFIVIGNFYDIEHIDTILLNNNYLYHKAYYFIDDLCISSDSIFCENNTSLTDKIHIQNKISVIPNPFNNITTVLINYEGKLRSIRIFDYTGVDVTQKVGIYDITEGNNNQFNLSKGSLTEGIYFLTIFTDYQTISTKLIITN
ncbi:MAG: T9SS type A sorting domain-containing protein [Bacteroidota bacterium]